MHSDSVTRLKRLYDIGITVPVINCVPGRAVKDKRNSLRQGGVGSIDWFSVEIDPLVAYLERRLAGICLVSVPVLGPAEESEAGVLPPMEEKFKIIAYCDDIKPIITLIEELLWVMKVPVSLIRLQEQDSTGTPLQISVNSYL